MTVATLSNKIIFNGNGSNTTFPFSFALPGSPTLSIAATFLQVVYTSPTGVQTVVTYGPGNTQYQLAINPIISPNPTPVGGTVTYNPGGTPIPNGSSLTILRVVPEVQGTSLQNQGTLWQTAIEQALDYLTLMVQQIQGQETLNITGNLADPLGLNYQAPPVAQRAGQALVFDGSGNVAAGAVPASGVISSAMAPVVNAASLSAGRTAFGLGTYATANFGIGTTGVGALNVLAPTFLQEFVNTNTTIPLVWHQSNIIVTGLCNLSFGAGNLYMPSYEVLITNISGGNVPLSLGGGDTFIVGGLQSPGNGTITIPQGQSVFVSTDAGSPAKWYVISMPGAQAPGSTGYFRNLLLTAAGANLVVNVAADLLVVADAGGNSAQLVAPALACNLATNGLNGLDTGITAGTTWYAIWVVYNPYARAMGTLASLQFIANNTFLSHLPAGYAAFTRVGAVRTNAGVTALLPSAQQGRRVTFQPAQYMTNGPAGTYSATTPAWAGVPWSPVAPSTAARLDLIVSNTYNGGAAANIIVAPSTTYTGPSGAIPPPVTLLSTAVATAKLNFAIETLNIQYAASAAGGAIFCEGYEDNL